MIGFLVRRTGQAVFVLLVISLLAFAVRNQLGDPLREMLGDSVSEAQRQALRAELGLDDPFWVQYGRFLAAALHGDFGTSYFFKEPALEVILRKLPATVDLVLGAVILIVLVAVPVGVLVAIFHRHWLARAVMAVSIVGISVPVFLTAIIAVYIFAVELDWLPSFGRGQTQVLFGEWSTGFLTADGLRHLILPCLSLGSIMVPLFIRLVRSEMVEVLQSDYIHYARAKGLSPARIYFVHALKNTLLPVMTIGGVQIGTMIAFTVLTETVFQWPGVGFLFLEAVNRADTPLIVAYLLFVGVVFVAVNTVVDIVYGWVNPRIRLTSPVARR